MNTVGATAYSAGVYT